MQSENKPNQTKTIKETKMLTVSGERDDFCLLLINWRTVHFVMFF